ncbi:type 1 glutamine amidotransferase [Aestuariivirga sp.]|jgi:GMP synthase-like glutamine amidotransferase|uniref:type 1 glutamine amidotransferase n=1 Tax=Aestuariivirga sp. TaxID=2650926 RepID=UPI00378524AE
MIRRALAFQHMDDEPPGLFGSFLAEEGAELDVVMLHRGEAIPSLAPYDFLLVMGGAMDVWETTQYPWLQDEIAAVREWTWTRNRPFMGVCLGLQLLAKALGGEVGLARAPEVGFGTVDLNALGLGHPMMRGLSPSFKVMQWHHAEVTRVPAGAEVLASSQVSPVQIMSVGQDILATQFHGELTPALIERWAHIPQYLEWLEQAMGPKAYDRVKAQSKPQMPKIERMGRIMFRNLIANRRSARTAA